MALGAASLVGIGGFDPQVRGGKLVVVLSVGGGRFHDLGNDTSAGHGQETEQGERLVNPLAGEVLEYKAHFARRDPYMLCSGTNFHEYPSL
jgi:hypothetical protein